MGLGETTAGYRQIIEEAIESTCGTKQELLDIAESCYYVLRYPACSFREVLQSLCVYQICILWSRM